MQMVKIFNLQKIAYVDPKRVTKLTLQFQYKVSGVNLKHTQETCV